MNNTYRQRRRAHERRCAGTGRTPRFHGATLVVLALAMVVAAGGPASAQQEPAAAAPAAADGIMLNFQDVPLDAVLEHLSEVAGLVVIKEVTVDGRVTVLSRQPVSVVEAVSLLNTVLKDEGYAAIRAGRVLRIVGLDEAKTRNVPVRSGNDPSAIEPNDEVITQVIPIRFADAVQLKQDLAPLISPYADLTSNASSNTLILTDTGVNVRRIVEIVSALDTHMASVAEVRVFHLTYADATTTARLINEVFKQEEPTTQRRGSSFGMSRFFRGPSSTQSSRSTEGGAPGQKVAAAADERTNTVVVSGSPDVLEVVENVIKDLDSDPAQEEGVFVYSLKNAQAGNVADLLNGLFEQSDQAQRTTGGPSGQRGQGTSGTDDRRAAFIRMLGGRTARGTVQAVAGLAGQVYVVADEDTNSLLILTSPDNFDRLRLILAELDRSIPQVLIKVLIAEVTHDRTLDLGVEFSLLNLSSDGTGSELFTDFGVDAATGGAIYKLIHGDVTAALRALEEVGELDILSRPYILASDNQTAVITVGEEVPFIRNTRTTETGQTINTIEYEDIGIILSVTPHINPEGLVIMDVSPEISAISDSTVPISETVDAAVFSKRSAETRVAIRDGQTIVIGGIMEDRKTSTIRKVPVLGDIPLIGALFRRTIESKGKTELLIFITPHVARQASDLESMSEDELRGPTVVPNAVEPGVFDEHMRGMQRGSASETEQ